VSPGDYVITEADRGSDVGLVIETDPNTTERERITAKALLRKATAHDIALLPLKQEREARARELCQEKANELGLPMIVTSTEMQFDGKKLTVYFSASQYIDFRNLVHTLFRVFGTRIWMVWYDEQGPVRDVFTHNSAEAALALA
jgi:cell fate regulator YaaT (PSP1 superfamily)